MIRIKDHKQLEIFDAWAFLSPKRRRMLDDSWPGLFKEHLLQELPVDQISPFFCQGFGRPSKELYSVLGVLLFQQTMDLNDLEAVEQLAFNIQWHYALNITAESDEAKYISPKTLWTMRQLLTERNLDQLLFDTISAKLAKVFGVDTDRQRIDSVHIRSNMRRLGRIGIFVQTIHKFLVNLKRQQQELFATVDSQVLDRYMGKKELAAFSMVKPSQAEKTLLGVSADLFALIEQFKWHQAVCRMQSYKLMQRVLAEQCSVHGSGVIVQKPKQIPADSLQNPSDPDAAYSGHKGQGYQVQVMETFTTTDDKTVKENTLNLITHVEVQKACEHDSTALQPAIKETQDRGLGPKTLLADTLYGSDDNVQAAQAAEVELVAPAMKGGADNGKAGLDSFSFDDSGKISACPAGQSPLKVKCKQKKNRFSAYFALDHCSVCPQRPSCPVLAGKKNYYLRYSAKDHRLAVRRAMQKSGQFIEVYRWRAGIEATMSQFDRLTGVKRLRVRAFKAVRFCATLKAAGLNILRAAAVRVARTRAARAHTGQNRRLIMPFPFFRERLRRFVACMGSILLPQWMAAGPYAQAAA